MNKIRPSMRWTSFEPWDFNGLKERLQDFLETLDTSVLVRHAEEILGQEVIKSEPFSAGQYWICFELVAEDGSLIIARVRLPRHPDLPASSSDEDERYQIDCEVATIQFVRDRLPALKVPRLYAYEGSSSKRAADAGAAYMLVEGIYGNTLQDVKFDICDLPAKTLEHIMEQWTNAQVEIATLAFPQIGSICSVSDSGEPVIGKVAAAGTEGLQHRGPFSTSQAYFQAIADTAVSKVRLPSENTNSTWASLGAIVFQDIVQNTSLYVDNSRTFALHHMDIGTQNILVDEETFDFVAIIDWEFAQTAPWTVNYYPMPFPLTWSDDTIQSILNDPGHLAHKNITRQNFARKLYVDKFREAEARLQKEGRALNGSFATALHSPASRVYACFSHLGVMDEADEQYVREMVRLAFGYRQEETDQYLERIRDCYPLKVRP